MHSGDRDLRIGLIPKCIRFGDVIILVEAGRLIYGSQLTERQSTHRRKNSRVQKLTSRFWRILLCMIKRRTWPLLLITLTAGATASSQCVPTNIQDQNTSVDCSDPMEAGSYACTQQNQAPILPDERRSRTTRTRCHRRAWRRQIPHTWTTMI